MKVKHLLLTLDPDFEAVAVDVTDRPATAARLNELVPTFKAYPAVSFGKSI